jgi:hypothetical protein
MRYWGKLGAFWGGLWGFLFGSAFFLIPGIGPVLVAGPLVSWIVGALEGAVITGGLTALGAALYGIGIPKNSVLEYETALKSDKFLVIAHGTAADVTEAKVAQRVVEKALADDEAAARAERLAEFHSDLEAYITREVLDICTVHGRLELPPLDGVQDVGFLAARRAAMRWRRCPARRCCPSPATGPCWSRRLTEQNGVQPPPLPRRARRRRRLLAA